MQLIILTSTAKKEAVKRTSRLQICAHSQESELRIPIKE